MILADANLLLYAYNAESDFHLPARHWLETQLSGTETFGLCWPVINAFLRIGTNSRLFPRAMTLNEAVVRIESWLNQPCVRILQPADHHWKIYQQMLLVGKATGNLVSDAHLAALAVEYNCVLCSTDSDFARFRGLKWKNPLG